MWCRLENNEIKRYSVIPECWKNMIGFNQLSTEVHETEGFFPMQMPEIDNDIQKAGELYFNALQKVFTYMVINKMLPTLAEAKAQKITELKSAVKELYQSIQWYLELCRAEGTAIPTTVTTKIKTIKTKYEQAKAQINGLTTIIDVIKWKVPYEQIELIRAQLEAIE